MLRRNFRNSQGASFTETSLLITFMSCVLLVALTPAGSNIKSIFVHSSEQFDQSSDVDTSEGVATIVLGNPRFHNLLLANSSGSIDGSWVSETATGCQTCVRGGGDDDGSSTMANNAGGTTGTSSAVGVPPPEIGSSEPNEHEKGNPKTKGQNPTEGEKSSFESRSQREEVRNEGGLRDDGDIE